MVAEGHCWAMFSKPIWHGDLRRRNCLVPAGFVIKRVTYHTCHGHFAGLNVTFGCVVGFDKHHEVENSIRTYKQLSLRYWHSDCALDETVNMQFTFERQYTSTNSNYSIVQCWSYIYSMLMSHASSWSCCHCVLLWHPAFVKGKDLCHAVKRKLTQPCWSAQTRSPWRSKGASNGTLLRHVFALK